MFQLITKIVHRNKKGIADNIKNKKRDPHGPRYFQKT